MNAMGMMPFGFAEGINLGKNFILVFGITAVMWYFLPLLIGPVKNKRDEKRKEAESITLYKEQCYEFAKIMKANKKPISQEDILWLEDALERYSEDKHSKLFQEWKSRMNQKMIFASSSASDDNSNTTSEDTIEVVREHAIGLLTTAIAKADISVEDGSEYIFQVKKTDDIKKIDNILVDAGIF